MSEIVVFSTATSADEAERIATVLVEDQLAACVNILPQIRSVYFWESELRRDSEALMIVKSVEEKLPELTERIRSLHSYSTPEIIALEIRGGSSEYLHWLRETLLRRSAQGEA